MLFCSPSKLSWLCPRSLKVRLVLTALVFVGLVSSVAFWGTVIRSSVYLLEKKCSNENSTVYLNNICRDYLNGLVTGSLCESLCVKNELEFVRCLGHGVKLHVLEARWGASTVILKATEQLSHPQATFHLNHPDKFTRKISKQEFIREANQTVFLNLAGGKYVSSALIAVERVFSECDVLEDGQLTYHEALVCWQLLETDEFILLLVLSGVSAIPDLYGTCGTMYAMQYATSEPFLSRYLADNRSWQFKARLAIALIEMVHSIEATPYGTLYLCDVQESNFGVVQRSHTRDLVAKTIDLDISWFEDTLKSSVKYENNKYCRSHIDCDMVSCLVACNTTTNACSGRLWSNNLQVICRRFFAQSTQWFRDGLGDQSHSVTVAGLLRDPPVKVKKELQSVLKQCTASLQPHPHINTTVMTQLLHLLRSSLDAEQPSNPALQHH